MGICTAGWGHSWTGEWWSPRDPPQQPQWAWVKASPLPPSPAFFLALRVPTLLPSDTYIYIYIYIIYNIGLSLARSLLSLAHSIFTLGDRTLISFLSAMGSGGCLPGAGLLDSSQDVGGAGWVMGDRASAAPAQPSPGQGPRGARSVWPPPDQAVTGSPGPLGLPGQSRWASGVAGGPGHSGFGEAPRTLGSSPPLGSWGAGGPQGLGQR